MHPRFAAGRLHGQQRGLLRCRLPGPLRRGRSMTTTATRISLAHGAGGRLSRQLVEGHFLPRFDNPALADLLDSAVIGELALTTDGYVVTPRFFPGGDLGRLAVCGTVNDLAMVGAEPLGLTASFMIRIEYIPIVVPVVKSGISVMRSVSA